MVQPGRPQMTVWRMCIACWILKSTHTHTQNMYCYYCFSIAAMVA